ncbi:hypothetical protein H263_02534 [Brachyspira hampsonii 30599]|nr:hypothetical protein H263_02534 [Brachyspira hampsonii 30599]
MLDSYTYIIIVPVSIIIVLGIIFFLKSIMGGSNRTYKPKDIKKKIDDLEKKIQIES